MKYLIPRFIVRQNKEGLCFGEFNAVAMFLDVKGFTSISEKLMKTGKEGAEILSTLLESIFKPVTRMIYESGGFVTGFAGDGITAVFPENECSVSAVLVCAENIKGFVVDNGRLSTKFGDFEFLMKIGISSGKVEWGTIGTVSNKTYYFRGNAIQGCADSEKKCKHTECVIDRNVYDVLDKSCINTVPCGDEYFVVKKVKSGEKPYRAGTTKTFEIEQAREMYSGFISRELTEMPYRGEFREITAVFVSFKEQEKYDELKTYIEDVLKKTEEFGGFFSSLDFGDKGCNFLVVFGAPKSFENDEKRAMEFALSLKTDSTKIGINKGTVYAGLIGDDLRCNYSFIGEAVIVASRFMQKAEPGEILVSKNINTKLSDEFEMEFVGDVSLKGKITLTTAFKLVGKFQKRKRADASAEVVGRKAESEIFFRAFGSLKEGKFGGVIHVTGEPGSGKTFLVQKMTELVKNEADKWIFNCDPILKKAFNPIVYCLKNIFNQLGNDDDSLKRKIFEGIFDSFVARIASIGKKHSADDILQELERGKYFIGALLNHTSEDSVYEFLDAKQRHENTLFAVKYLLTALSLLKPAVLFVDDFQWVDDESYRFFEILMRGLESYPVCVVIASRLNDDGSPPRLIGKEGWPAQEVNLKGLDPTESTEMIRNILKKNVSEKAFEMIFEKTQGNPFYLDQFCLYLKENNFLKDEREEYTLESEVADVPENISSVIVARIDRLPLKIKETLQIASVLGKEFEREILFSVSSEINNIDRNDFDKTLLDIRKENLITDVHEKRFTFKSNFLRDVVYEMQLKSRLKYIHGTAADTLEKMFAGKPEFGYEIASHYYYSEERSKALAYYRVASDYLSKAYRNREAIESLNKIIELSDNENEKRLTFFRIAEIEFFSGDWKKLLSDLLYLTEEVKDKLDAVAYLDSMNRLAQLYLYTGKIDRALDTAKLGLSYCGVSGREEKKEMFLGVYGQIYYHKGEFDKAMGFYEKQKKCHQVCEDNKKLSLVFGNIGLIHWNKGEFEKAIDCYKKQIEICESENDIYSLSVAYLNMGSVFFHKSEIDEAMMYFSKAKYLCEKMGYKRVLSAAIGNIGGAYMEKGNTDKAFEYYARKKKMSVELGEKSGIGLSVGNMGCIYMEKGEYEKALDCFNEKQKVCEELADRKGFSYALGFKGDLYRRIGKWDKAAECYENVIKICSELGFKMGVLSGIAGVGYILAEKKDYFKALEKFKEALELEKEIGTKIYPLYYYAGICFSELDSCGDLKNEIDSLTGLGLDPNAYFEYSLEHMKKDFDTVDYATVLSKYGTYLKSVGITEKGEDCKKRAEEIIYKLQKSA